MNSSLSVLTIDIPLDGMGLVGIPAAEAISPVFTLWITLVVMYLGKPPTISYSLAQTDVLMAPLFVLNG